MKVLTFAHTHLPIPYICSFSFVYYRSTFIVTDFCPLIYISLVIPNILIHILLILEEFFLAYLYFGFVVYSRS